MYRYRYRKVPVRLWIWYVVVCVVPLFSFLKCFPDFSDQNQESERSRMVPCVIGIGIHVNFAP
jgi:hypothetical protein